MHQPSYLELRAAGLIHRYRAACLWPAPGSEDTELAVSQAELKTTPGIRQPNQAHPKTHASLTDWVPNFTKPFLALGPEIFGNEAHRPVSLNALTAAHNYLGVSARTFVAWLGSLANPPRSQSCREANMASYSPELIQTMRAALDEVMTKIPLEQATPGIKAALAECILKAAANGQTSYDGLIAAATEQIQTILSMLT